MEGLSVYFHEYVPETAMTEISSGSGSIGNDRKLSVYIKLLQAF